MKTPKHLATVMAITMVAGSVAPVMAATTSSETIIGNDRHETAVKISKDGWSSAETVILVNSSAIPDALTATPLAHAKKAPILLTGKDGLNKATANEIKRLGAKDVIMIGGDAVLSAKVEKDLKALNLKVDRIKGETREETALAIAKRLDGIKDVSEIAVVNGTTGLADAVSVAAAAAEKGMPILLANPKKGLSAAEKFIKDEAIKASFIIGGTTVLPEKLVSSLPGKQRIEGSNRNDTNAKVIEKFYGDKELDNLYLAKDGRDGDTQLIDALAVGALAAKNGAPVLIASKKLSEKQIDVINTKKIDTITQVGGKGNEGAFNQLKDIEETDVYEVGTVEELKEALEKANANDKIVLKPNATITEDIIISTDKNVDIKVEGTVTGKVDIDAPNGNVTDNSTSKPSTGGGGSIVVDGPEVARVSDEKELKKALENETKTTIKLNNSIEIEEGINIPRNLTLDLNGKTITNKASKNARVILVEKSGITVNVKNGNISIPNGEDKGQNVAVFVKNKYLGKDNAGNDKYETTVGSTVNLSGINISMGGFTNTSVGVANDANIYGAYVNGTCQNISMNLDKCKINGVAMGVYFPATGSININESEINAGTAVAIKSGSGKITKSTLKGTKLSTNEAIAESDPNKSGSTDFGEALYIEGNYDRNIKVEVEDSTLESEKGYGVRMQFFNTGYSQTLNIKGGSVKGALGTIFDRHADNKNENYKNNDPEIFKKSLTTSGVTFEVTDEETLKNAIANSKKGDKVLLSNDITVDEQIKLSPSGETVIDLNNKTLNSTVTSAKTFENIGSNKKLTLKNGNLNAKSSGVSVSTIKVDAGGSVTLDGVNYTTEGTGVFVEGDSAEINVKNKSNLYAKGFCVATNAAKKENYFVKINLNNSTFGTAEGGAPVLLNVPGTLNITNCEINGLCQGVIVRGGTATITSTTITNNVTTKDKTYLENWGQGNQLPQAALVVGNRTTTAYQYASNVTLTDCTITQSGHEDIPAIYMWGNEAEGFGATLTHNDCTINGKIILGNNKCTINGEEGPLPKLVEPEKAETTTK